ncbi:unnamed protein product [Mytilus coruscus]|uniref:Integrase catalytic domain-containing protein n=1 Tax=Mytilus coruscus TaxID=42192 RepID=A0A6J8D804_MYTCO|nr:unnamed protein product [Mytilus coruscus]
MEIQHRKGSLHTNADGLSRTPKRKCKQINCPECTEMKTDIEYIEYFENVKTKDCIDDLNTVKDSHASSCLSIQSVINDTETDGDTDSVRGCLATHLAIRPVNVNTEEISFDITSNWLKSYAIPNHQALTVAYKLVTEFICRFGCPFQIHTDQGREFESDLFAAICDKLGIDKTRTCPYRPQSDGMVERFNQTLQSILRLFVNEHRNDWDNHIPFINMAYRATQHASTKCSPNLLMFGHKLRCPIDVMFG